MTWGSDNTTGAAAENAGADERDAAAAATSTSTTVVDVWIPGRDRDGVDS